MDFALRNTSAATVRAPFLAARGGSGAASRDVTIAPLDLADLETGVALLPQCLAQLAVVERAPAPRQPEASRAVRRVERHARDLLADRALDAHRLQPRGGRGAGAGLPLADLVAVDDEHVGAAAGQLARDRQPGEGGAADEHVGTLVQRRPLGAAQGAAPRHGRSAPQTSIGSRRTRTPSRRPRTSKPTASTRSSTDS